MIHASHSCLKTRVVHALTVVAAISAALSPAIARPPENGGKGIVNVYCSVDEGFARDILERFEKQTGANIAVTFDSEAGKTTGLFNKIVAESRSGRPRADVFWSSELFNTILLARKGLLSPYQPKTAADIPERYKDKNHLWTALALRGRVLAFDPARASPEEGTIRWEDMAQPSIAKYTVIANPLFGTTRGHVSAMFALWGPKRARAFLQSFRDHGGQIADGNSTAVRRVISGQAAFAATDTDDVFVAQKTGVALEFVYPDMGDGGTLLIPCSVALIKGRPDNAAARKLVDYLISADVETLLAKSDSHNIPVRQALRNRLDMQLPPETSIGFDKITDAMETAMEAVREILLR